MKEWMEATDARLLRQSQRRPDAFVEVCSRHANVLERWLVHELGDETLARDLLAETFAQAWYSRRRFRDLGDGSARPWLFGIARNLVRRVYRERAIEQRARTRLGLPVAETDAYADVLERLAAAQELGGASIPEALELRVVHGLEYEEIGRRLDLTPAGARTRVFRALGTLRSQLGRST
jgi:RNA polymerase sigma factor (sigma-70 family)